MAASSRSPESAPIPGNAANAAGDAAAGTAEAPVIHDVLIIGGGLVGSSLAIALEPLAINVGLVEAVAPGPSDTSVFDQRNLSFAEATVNALAALGVMQELASPGGPIKRIHVSRRGDFGRSVLEAANHDRSEFGRVVVARDFGDALEKRLSGLQRLRRYRPARFLGFSETAHRGCRAVRLAEGDGERTVLARLVVGADGTRSAVRGALGIGTSEHDYRQTLFVTRLRTDRAPDGTAYERLGDDGPTALLPRGDRHYGLVHAVARDDADAVGALDEAGFLDWVQEAFGWRAGRFLACGPRVAYPLVRVLADRQVAERVVLVGNAAQTIHPLGAQGFNLGLRDALTLAELISNARDASAPVDCGDAELLSAYVAARAEDRRRTLEFSDGLARLTANPSELLRPLRSIGLLAIDRLPSLQAEVVAGALGYRADVPALCRPDGAQS
ncbi:2-octaprenyl-6-methoxyphenyl hydroxylase [Lysobacter sp. H23M47]|uniref:2-octaprenyl-6-methoxyphenyl hydroxylase n=1 Tax=Lysobacter sp. H23M47 TaxID=2781024 RepID=UPI0018827BF9|nr:2-octaprenyl-6-methoxyphenyl hydroxylase [Lysobacter sp. H23M47]QOW24078.1 2-octaprenyl-6-methoxyphenyl hydroxylase [Lysobacter sp. H23M47]